MTRARRVLAGVLVLLFACKDESPLEPVAPEPPLVTNPTPEITTPAGPAPQLATLAACTHHWASGVSGLWFTAANWSPATVPGAGSTACIDAAGTYTVTMDPSNDATPVDLDGLSVGGAAGVQTVLLGGVGAAIVNVATGVDIKTSGVLSVSGQAATLLATPSISNAGTLQSTALCCGTPTVRADLSNSGTLKVSSNGLLLDKLNGAYANTGVIDLTGELGIPAAAGNPSFTQQSGSLGSTAVNPNGAFLRMKAGTFTYNGGDVLLTAAGVVVLDGANLVFGTTPVGTAGFNMLPSATGNSFTGNIGATHTLRMPTVGGAPTMTSRTLTLAGDVTNAGTVEIQGSPGTNFPIIAGTGTLTNTGTLKVTGTGNDSSRIAINLLNQGTLQFNGTNMRFDQTSLSYTNAGTLQGTGRLIVDNATLTNQAAGKLTISNTRLQNSAHLRGTGTNTTALQPLAGTTVEPGLSLGVFTSGSVDWSSGGTLEIELGGETAGTNYDQLVVAGQNTFVSGKLNIHTVNGFVAGLCGQVFDIVTHQSPGGTGTFATINGLDQGGGKMLRAVYTNPSLTGPGVLRLVGFDGGQAVAVQPNPVDLAEGGPTKQYYVCLNAQPTGTVTITPSPDGQVTVSPSSISFSASDWNLPKAFTISAVDDQLSEGAHAGHVSHTVTSSDSRFSGFAVTQLVANITDNDVTNRNPNASNDAATTPQGSSVVINVLSNDSDPDGDALTVSAVTQPANGSAAISGSGQNVTYTPPADFSGSASFSYTASDGKGGAATASVSVTVTAAPPPGDRAPIAVNDVASTIGANAVVIQVLSNDSDPDGDPLRVTAVTQPASGTAAISGGGQTVTYTPSSGASTTALFTYTVSDGRGGTASATVTVTVSGGSNPPPPPAQTRADLAISVTDTPDPAFVGQTVTYHVVIRNFGPTASRPTTMRFVWLTRGVTPILRGSGCRILLNPNGFECNVPSIPAAGLVQGDFTLTWNGAPGPVINLSEVTPNPLSSDPNWRNNAAVTTTTFRRLGGFAMMAAPSASAQASAPANNTTFAGWELGR
ncbi:MAG TPA: cadherin-like domain-containing protein [Gemmatimonadales bacterium]